MQAKYKLLLNKWLLGNRPNKQALGMTFTNERRARKTGNSFLIAQLCDRSKYKMSRETSRLSVYGTLDVLACGHTYKVVQIKKEHPTDKGYFKQVFVLSKNK